MKGRTALRFGLIAISVLTGIGCGSDSSEPAEGKVCPPGDQKSCACVGGLVGAQRCLADGSGYDECMCPDSSAGGGTQDASPDSDAQSKGGSAGAAGSGGQAGSSGAAGSGGQAGSSGGAAGQGEGGAAGQGGTACTPPATPASPTPTDGALDVNASAIALLDWADSTGATGYDVYFGVQCPPPAWPDAGYQHVTSSELKNVTATAGSAWCWKVVAIGAESTCVAEGPDWSFTTSSCQDPVPGAPMVTSTNHSFPASSTSGQYTLTFSEEVANVAGSLTWTAVKGTGKLDSVSKVDGKTYTIAFSGVKAGDQYLLSVDKGAVDACGTSVPSVIELRIDVLQTGLACAQAANLQNASFPITLPGIFPMDPVAAGSCVSYYGNANNAVWFTYEPPFEGWYEIIGKNSNTSNVALAAFESDSCVPFGKELYCGLGNTSSKTQLYLKPGTRTLFALSTQSDGQAMQDPTVTISPLSAPGLTCEEAADLSSVAFPYILSGSYPYDLWAGPSCDATAFNMAWFKYTAATTGWHSISAYNSAPGVASGVRMAIYDGVGCSPRGPELSCTQGASSANRKLILQSGETYLVQLAMDTDALALQDPLIDIAALNIQTGEECSTAIDANAGAMPFKVTGDFDDEIEQVGSCDDTPNNVVWFKYTVPVTGWYDISVETEDPTKGNVVVAVWEGTGCSVHGPELACGYTGTRLHLHKGKTYLVAAHTTTDAKRILNPTLKVLPQEPGDSCETALDLTGQAFPHTLAGTFNHVVGYLDCGTYGSKTLVWTKYTSSADGWYSVTSPAGTRLAIWESDACEPYGERVYCTGESAAQSNQVPVELKKGTTYLIAMQSSTSAITDPVIDIQPGAAAGAVCDSAIDISAATFPHQIPGTFTTALGKPGSCGYASNNLWLKYTASASGWHDFEVTNNDTTGRPYIAIFDGTSCDSVSQELICRQGSNNIVAASADLVAGRTYTLGLSASYNTSTLKDPVVSITPSTSTFGAGAVCDQAINLTGATFPLKTMGDFVAEPEDGAPCQTSDYNLAWFTYTPTVSGWFNLTAKSDDTYADLSVAAWQGTGCIPKGKALGCGQSSTNTATVPVNLLAGEPILIVSNTAYSSQRNLNPTIDLQPRNFGPAQVCATAIDLSAATMPYPVPTISTVRVEPGASCDPYPDYEAWFKYTPPASGWYEIAVANSSSYGVGLSLFDGTGCNPRGNELYCDNRPGTAPQFRVWLDQGTWYTMMLDTEYWLGGTVNVTPSTEPIPGDRCETAATTTSANHSVDPSGKHCWTWAADTTNTVTTAAFACDSATGGDVFVEYTTGPDQTALYYDAAITGFQSGGKLAFEIERKSCPNGYSSLCVGETAGLTSKTGAIAVDPNTKYYLHLADAVAGHGLPQSNVCIW